MKQSPKERSPSVDPKLTRVAKTFAGDPQVSYGGGKGFGSGALKVNGKIFAMMSSQGELVVKLSKKRVDELVSKGKGERFDPGRGRAMKEWVVIPKDSAAWVPLAQEACDFVRKAGR